MMAAAAAVRTPTSASSTSAVPESASANRRCAMSPSAPAPRTAATRTQVRPIIPYAAARERRDTHPAYLSSDLVIQEEVHAPGPHSEACTVAYLSHMPDAGDCKTTHLAGKSCDDGKKCTSHDTCDKYGICKGKATVCNGSHKPCAKLECNEQSGMERVCCT
jgi:hypothetical protein